MQRIQDVVTLQAACALFLGVVVGVSWGSVAKFLPRCRDPYVTELRVLFVVVGGLFANFLTSQYGWGGTGEFEFVLLFFKIYWSLKGYVRRFERF